MKEYTWITQYIYPFVLLTVEAGRGLNIAELCIC